MGGKPLAHPFKSGSFRSATWFTITLTQCRRSLIIQNRVCGREQTEDNLSEKLSQIFCLSNVTKMLTKTKMSTITDECFCNHKSFKDKMTNGRCLCHVPLKHWNSQNPSNFSVNLSHPTFTGRQDGYFCATLGAEEAGETIAPCSELLPLLFVIVTHSLPLLFVIATHPLPLPLLFVIGTH